MRETTVQCMCLTRNVWQLRCLTLIKYKLIELYVGEIKGKVYFKFHKAHLWAKSVLLNRNKALFVVNKA